MAGLINASLLNGSIRAGNNQTTLETWSYLPVFGIIVLIAAFLTNSTLLLTLLRNPQLRTPFTVYIINLLISNTINTLFPQIFDIVSMVRPWPALGWGFCEAYLYTSYIVHAAVYNSHFFIALNRIWAVVSPMTYRHYHTKQKAIIVSIALWIYIHMVNLPGFIRDHVYHHSTLDKGKSRMCKG